MIFIDLTGQKFGELTVIKRVDNIGTHAGWLCQCSCGNQTIVGSNKLRGGSTISCGHLKSDVKHNRLREGYSAKKKNGVATFLLDSNRKVRNDSSTGITGVKKIKYRDGSIHYAADITVRGKRTRIGTFSTIEEAAHARKIAAKKILDNLK